MRLRILWMFYLLLFLHERKNKLEKTPEGSQALHWAVPNFFFDTKNSRPTRVFTPGIYARIPPSVFLRLKLILWVIVFQL